MKEVKNLYTVGDLLNILKKYNPNDELFIAYGVDDGCLITHIDDDFEGRVFLVSCEN